MEEIEETGMTGKQNGLKEKSYAISICSREGGRGVSPLTAEG